jgi:hypothetical protein
LSASRGWAGVKEDSHYVILANLQSVVNRQKQQELCGIERESLIIEYSKDCEDETSRASKRERALGEVPRMNILHLRDSQTSFSVWQRKKSFHPAKRRFINSLGKLNPRGWGAFRSHNINQIFTRERGALIIKKKSANDFGSASIKLI